MTETQKRKFSENDGELIEIYASIGDVRVELKDDIDYIDYKLEEFMKSMVKTDEKMEDCKSCIHLRKQLEKLKDDHIKSVRILTRLNRQIKNVYKYHREANYGLEDSE